MICKKCKAEIDENATFCPNCGEPCEPVSPDSADAPVKGSDAEAVVKPEENSQGKPAVESEATVLENGAADGGQGDVPEEKVCPACGAKLEADTVFCPECGARTEGQNGQSADISDAQGQSVNGGEPGAVFCPNCGQRLETGSVFCDSCGSRVDGANEPAAQVEGVSAVKPKKKIWLPIAAGAAAVVVIVAAIFLMKSAFSKGDKLNFVYSRDNGLYQVRLDSKKKEPAEFTDELMDDGWDDRGEGGVISSYMGTYVAFSKDGKYVYYPEKMTDDGDFSLIRRTLKKDETERVDSSVYKFDVLDNGDIVYMKSNDSLYFYSKGNKQKLASDVSLYKVSEDEKNLFWAESDGDEFEYVLYCQALDGKSEMVKLESGVTSLERISDDLNTILFSKDESVYVYKDLKEKQKLVSDAEALFVDDIDSLTFYYTQKVEKKSKASSYVDDDMASADAAMTRPDIADYQRQEIVSGWYSDYTTTVTDDSYYTDLDAYDEKLYRDSIRADLANLEIDDSYIELYYYKDDEKTLLDSNFSSNINYGEGSLLFMAYEESEIKKVKLSELYYADEVSSRVQEAKNTGGVYKLAQGVNLEELDYEYISYPEYSKDDKKIYILTSDEEPDYSNWDADEETGYELYSISLADGIGDPELLDEDVNTIECLNGSDLYYIKDAKEEVGDLYCNGKSIAFDVYEDTVVKVPDSASVVYAVDPNKDKGYATLNMYKNGKEIKIQDDVSYYDVIGDNSLVMLTEYNFDRYRGDLKYFNGKDVDDIDSDVWAFFSIGNAGGCGEYRYYY